MKLPKLCSSEPKSPLLQFLCLLSTQFGIYEKGCGIENITMSWGHDEYLYHVLINHGATIPEEGLYMIRYHSFYPWHSGNDYGYFNSPKDLEMLEWVREFQ